MSTISRPRFAALQALLTGSTAVVETPAPGDAEAAPGTGEGEEGEEGGEAAPAPAPEAAPAPAPEAPADGTADAPPAAGVDAASFKAGADAANLRWAGILTNASCLANIELAAQLAVETNFTATKIGELCAIGKTGDPAALALLDRTEKPNLGTDARDESTKPAGDTPGQVAGKSAVDKINQRRAGRGGRKAADKSTK